MMKDFVDELVRAAQARVDEGSPLKATELGAVLGPFFTSRNHPTGKGAFAPVVRQALAEGRIRHAYSPDGAIDYLIPAGVATPHTLSDVRAERARQPAASTDRAIERGLYRAFSGIESPRFADPSHPPLLRVLTAPVNGAIPIAPVERDALVREWDDFCRDASVPAETASAVRNTLSTAPAQVAWGRIEMAGDGPATRWGARFHTRRIELLLRHYADWAKASGLEPSAFKLTAPPRVSRADLDTSGHGKAPADMTDALRARLKWAIDRMSLEQLLELRVPAELLLH